MTTLKLILAGIGGVLLVIWFVRLMLASDGNRADGCIYKSPGHHGPRRHRFPRRKK